MSMERLRELKLYKKLERDLNYRDRLEEKIRLISSTNPTVDSFKVTRKINNNVHFFTILRKSTFSRKNATSKFNAKIVFSSIKYNLRCQKIVIIIKKQDRKTEAQRLSTKFKLKKPLKRKEETSIIQKIKFIISKITVELAFRKIKNF
jgi:hypothetical protein